MRKLSILAALTLSLFGAFAEAQFAQPGPYGPPGWCYIQAHLRMRSGAFLFGGAEGHGFGRIVCEYADNTAEVLPILIDTSAFGLGFEIPEEFDAKMFTSGLIGVSGHGAAGYLGTYMTSRLKLGIGPLNGELGLNANLDGFSIPFTVQLDAEFQAVAATLKFGEMVIRFDPRNIQARHLHEWHDHFPPPPPMPRGYHHHHVGHRHPLPPPRPAPCGSCAPCSRPGPGKCRPAPAPAPASTPAPAPGKNQAPPPPKPPETGATKSATGAVQGQNGAPGEDGASDGAPDQIMQNMEDETGGYQGA